MTYGLDVVGSTARESLLRDDSQLGAVDGTHRRTPPDGPAHGARAYAAAGLPWFDYFGGDLTAISGTDNLRGHCQRGGDWGGERRDPAAG